MKTLLAVLTLTLVTTSAHACKLSPIGAQLLNTKNVMDHISKDERFQEWKLVSIQYGEPGRVELELARDNSGITFLHHFSVKRSSDCKGNVTEVRE